MNDYPVDNTIWSDWHCNSSHIMLNGMQYTIQNCGRFIQLDEYSWRTTNLNRKFFFIEPMIESHRDYFWNCKSIDRAIALIKHYIEDGCEVVNIQKDNLSFLLCDFEKDMG